MPVTSVRELRVLQACRHENLVHLRGVVTGSKLDRQCGKILPSSMLLACDLLPPEMSQGWQAFICLTTPRSVYLVFEYIGGGDLARVLDTMDVPFQLSHTKALVRQLLKACEFLHNRWIVHRDLKLSNLLITDECALCFRLSGSVVLSSQVSTGLDTDLLRYAAAGS